MKTPYCGMNKTLPRPKTQKRGSMKECAELGQIRYYGLHKIDEKTAFASRNKRSNEKAAKTKLLNQFGSLNGKIMRIKKDMPREKDAKKKAEMKELLTKMVAEVRIVGAKLNKLNSEINERDSPIKRGKKSKKGSKKTSRGGSRRVTRRRRSSRSSKY